ncbi:MAG: sulfotransferase [Planctomycetes bacterium]|nr:sulfotransferase [Planctomycetota bacterium]
MSVATAPAKTKNQPTLREHIFAPRFWVGMNARGWWKLLAENRFDIGWQYWHVAAAISGWSALNSVWGTAQQLAFGGKVDRIELVAPPIIVLGHWRSGTTLLHELMVLDPRHSFPNTYECLAPNHFLSSEKLITQWFHSLLPARRQIDNMSAGWDRPQEEEFALCNLGVPSPYLQIAFPNHRHKYDDYLTLENVPPKVVNAWKQTLLRFLKQITLQNPKRLVLKSPPHTARVSTLVEMFPEAKFVHVIRDPNAVFTSTYNLWRTLYTRHGLQRPNYEGLEEYVLSTFERMYRKYERDRALLRPDQLVEVRYEDLVANPIGEMEAIYEQMQLGGFDELRPRLEAYVQSLDGYQTNRYDARPEHRKLVAERWQPLMQRYGYEG